MERAEWLIGGGELEAGRRIRGLLIRTWEFLLGIDLGSEKSETQQPSLYARAVSLLARTGRGAGRAVSGPFKSIVQDEFFFVEESDRRFPGQSTRYSLARVCADPFSRRWTSARAAAPSADLSGADWLKSLRAQLVARLSAPRIDKAPAALPRPAQPNITRYLDVAGSLQGHASTHQPLRLPRQRYRPSFRLWTDDPGGRFHQLQLSRFPLYSSKTSHDPSRSGGNRSILMK